MRARIIVNPNAGSFDAARDAIEAAGARPDCEVVFTERKGDAGRLAQDAVARGFERVVAGGGDGTLHEVVNGVGAHGPAVVGLLPLGTGNDFARGVGIPLEAYARAVEIALEARPKAVDLIRCRAGDDERLVVNAGAAGINEAIHDEVDAAIKKRWGPVAYLVAAAKQVIDPPVYDLRMTMGDRSFAGRVHGVVIANAGRIGGGLIIAPDASPSDGEFEVVVLPEQSTASLLSAGLRVLLGSEGSGPEVITFRAARLGVAFDRPVRFHLDGEGVEHQRFAFESLPRALRFAAPDSAEGE